MLTFGGQTNPHSLVILPKQERCIHLGLEILLGLAQVGVKLKRLKLHCLRYSPYYLRNVNVGLAR